MPQHRENRVRLADEHGPHYPAVNRAVMENPNMSMAVCCVPSGCHVGEPIHMDDLANTVKVICNNEHCQEGQFMHKACFDQWEGAVLTYLRSTGRARSWSEKQRLQNLWTKKGYDLAYKACGCKCGKGHLRKDLDWVAPVSRMDDNSKKKKPRKKKNEKPTLTLNSGNNTTPKQVGLPVMRLRSSSMSSTGSGSGSPPSSSSEFPPSPTHVMCKKTAFFGDRRERHGSGNIFSRRQDYSSFNTLPWHKINSYNIKMEDEGSHGNDDIRCFLLSTLSANKMIRVSCMLCTSAMSIFDRYPLIDGTFFLSPRQYGKPSIPVTVDGKMQHLNAVCMSCLEGWNSCLRCRSCGSRWSGKHLILGTMYSYDIFAATPCCEDRLRCINCQQLIISADQRLQFFSDYSHSVACSHCGVQDFHFVKPMSTYYMKTQGT